ncbi:hypothetical protein DICPUDRAFT_157967 [Dictyostelium purpureum]|uniref:Protein kinase domain-containing protein n=1 Tax=Dictyostelium purpureum TaxID=5786 RepID=F1A0H3_DICPU|nr:uncharacterized protein DICPUDRAFT_157967 [Dictyostelium purpureum]EGC30317.1 hypothetical protein DICPUDRAFT_157967 [Dictyostelium purpureum]|eukprot:XP_003293168.1 hypothetical protein DICPUDRAFT_157967 [Dictyostelium purpureum]
MDNIEFDNFEDIKDFNDLVVNSILKFEYDHIKIEKVTKRENIIVFGTREKDQKPVVIKYIVRENKKNKENVENIENKENKGDEEVKALKELSYHPNLILLLNSVSNITATTICASKKNDRNIILLEKGSKIKFYKNDNEPSDDSNHLLKSIFCQYVVFLSFGHSVKRFQRDVKLDNTVLLPPVFLDQTPYLRVIDFELSSSITLLDNKLYPDRARGTEFYGLLEERLHHLHLAETYFLCSAFSNVESLQEKGFTVEKSEVQEIEDLLKHKGVTLFESSVYILPEKIPGEEYLNEKLKAVLEEINYNFEILREELNESGTYSYSKVYLDRCENKFSSPSKDKSSKDLFDSFESEMKKYQKKLTDCGYYSKIEEHKIKKFGFGDIDEKNILFKDMEEAFGFEFEPLNDNENIFDGDYIESEMKCLKSIEGITSIGNLILENNKNSSLEKKREEKFYLDNGGEIGKLEREIVETQKKIDLLNSVLPYLEKEKKPSKEEISELKLECVELINDYFDTRNQVLKDTKSVMDEIIQITKENEKSEIILKLLKLKHDELERNKNLKQF